MNGVQGYQSLSIEQGDLNYGIDPNNDKKTSSTSKPPALGANAGSQTVLVRGTRILSIFSVPSLVLIAFGVCLAIILIGFACYKYSEISACLGPPYLYVSHSKEHNIYQITRDGCMRSTKVLFGVPRTKMDLRSMSINQYMGEPALYVADSRTETSQIMVFGECSYWSGMRSLRTTLFTTDGPFGTGAQHPYGITFDFDENIYSSFQHTNVVLRASRDSFNALQTFQRLAFATESKNSADVWYGSRSGPYPGTFFQFGNGTGENPQDQGVRGIAWVMSNRGPNLWMNNELDNAVYIVDAEATRVKLLSVKYPVGIFHNPEAESIEQRQLVYVGSRGKKSGFVYAFDKDTFKLVKQYTLIGMTHPTGIAVHDVLYVADQRLGAILTFDLNSTQFIKNIWERSTGGDLEQITLTNC